MDKERKIEDYVEYDETSSTCLRWKKSTDPKIWIGKEFGSTIRDTQRTNKGYYYGFFNYKGYYSHQVVCYLHYGVWSNREIVVNHIDGNGLNNKIGNLELISHKDNLNHLNRRSSKPNKVTKVRGVYPSSTNNKYKVTFKGIYRGRVDTLEEGIELWNKCFELDKQGVVYKETRRKTKKKLE